MAKLYPPILEGTIPAFTGATLVVPFSMNKAVGANEVGSMVIKIKRINNNDIIMTRKADYFDVYNSYQATFILTQEEQELFNIGQFYRVQLAYEDNSQPSTIGYFSTVGVIKYTGKPEIGIKSLDALNSNLHTYDYIGYYKQEADPTEKLYSTRFQVFDKDEKIVEDSGELIHNSSEDVSNESLESFSFYQDFEENQLYHLVMTMTSVNGLTLKSPRYRLVQRDNTDGNFDELDKIRIEAIPNFEEGYCKVQLKPTSFSFLSTTGVFVLFRSENKKPYVWEKISQFSARMEPIDQIYKIDTTVHQGKTYIYSLQQKNNQNIYSRRIFSKPVLIDFEDMFLMDGERSLKIRFNPKVSSLKDTISESRVNTIGSQFPFITRNAHVYYKEFSISGLISHLMDDNKRFMSWKELGLEQYITNLTTENIYGERHFKLEVLKWLNNGQPKVFKSPVEGNYIVRLMNVSLSPNDTVGRMLHSFNCSAVEVAPFDYKHLLEYKFINLEATMSNVAKFSSIPFWTETTNADGTITKSYKTGELLKGQELYSFEVNGLTAGDYFEVNGEKIVVGATGAYQAKITSPIYSFKLPNNARYGTGVLTGEFKGLLETDLDKIYKIRMVENPAKQFIGNSYWRDQNDPPVFINIIDSLSDTKTKIVSIPRIRFYKRGIHKIYVAHDGNKGSFTTNSRFYSVGHSLDDRYLVTLSDLEKLSLYEIHYSSVNCTITNENGVTVYHYNGKSFLPYSEEYYDPLQGIIEDSYDIFDINVNNKYINLKETEEMEIKYINYNYLAIGDGVIAELAVVQQVIDYAYEFEDETIKEARKDYDDLYKKYTEHVISPNYNATTLERELKQLKQAYKVLVDLLTQIILQNHVKEG